MLRFEHPKNAFSMLVTLSGIMILVSFEHPENAEFSIDSIPSCSSMLSREEQI
jgi:hypothetical protein